jgi:flavin reductase (DIM6/NTAB) family NADH-FMN oxidoreductase RutF
VIHAVTIGSHMQITGEVKNILADESILNEKGRILLDRHRPIIYDEEQVQYLSLGKKAADAFRPGMEMKKS